MTKKERVEAVLAGQRPDRIPTGFWMHFPESDFFGRASVERHLAYFGESGTDICKVMTENLYPYCRYIRQAADWRKVEAFDEDAGFIRDQADIIRQIARECPDASIAATIHGVFASASHTLMGEQRYDKVGRYAQLYHLRTDKAPVLEAYENIAKTLVALVRASVRAGAEGIYYAALGGEADGLTAPEHREFLAGLDKRILSAAYDAGAKYVVLHMCKPHVDLKRFLDYPCDVVNWGIEESGVSLAEGRSLFPGKTLLGGFNCRHGALIDGTDEEIFEFVRGLAESAGRDGLILGADCTLPGTLPYGRIRKVAEASALLG